MNNSKTNYEKLIYLFILSFTFVFSPIFSSSAMATRVEAEVNVTKPSKADSDSKSSILLLTTTRDLRVETDQSWAEADASVWTLFYSGAYARGEADGTGYSFNATASTYYHGKRQDYKNVWGPKSLNIVLPEVLLYFTGTGLSAYSFSFFETDDPTNIFFQGDVFYSSLGLKVSGDLSFGDFNLTPSGYLLTNTNISIDDSIIPTDVDLTFANTWHADGSGVGSARSLVIPEPSTLLLFGNGLAGIIVFRRKRLFKRKQKTF